MVGDGGIHDEAEADDDEADNDDGSDDNLNNNQQRISGGGATGDVKQQVQIGLRGQNGEGRTIDWQGERRLTQTPLPQYKGNDSLISIY